VPLVGPPFWFEFDTDFDERKLSPHRLQLRELVECLSEAIADERNYPEDSVEFELKMVATLRQILSEFKNEESRAD
jgi:hypothetical protein